MLIQAFNCNSSLNKINAVNLEKWCISELWHFSFLRIDAYQNCDTFHSWEMMYIRIVTLFILEKWCISELWHFSFFSIIFRFRLTYARAHTRKVILSLKLRSHRACLIIRHNVQNALRNKIVWIIMHMWDYKSYAE